MMRDKSGIKILRTIVKTLPHINIIISGMYIVFFIVDQFNPSMAFINNPGTKMILIILSVCSTICSVFLIAYQRKSM